MMIISTEGGLGIFGRNKKLVVYKLLQLYMYHNVYKLRYVCFAVTVVAYDVSVHDSYGCLQVQ